MVQDSSFPPLLTPVLLKAGTGLCNAFHSSSLRKDKTANEVRE